MSIHYYDWEVVRKIGAGSFGTVYEIQRRSFDTVYHAALKVITIPHSESELENIRNSGMDDASVTDYFESVASEIVHEFEMMNRLKGNTNIVSYEDHLVRRHKDQIGWDIMIRMELLTSLNRYLSDHTMSRREVIRLGIDLCRALERCQMFDIIHRDIKPDNIFISPQGDYKLGDFGIARTAEHTMSGMSRKGTFTYMAPEVYMGKAYGPSVDLYSLGLVMYRLLNRNRGPFMPPYPEKIKYRDQEQALLRRMSGEALLPPCDAGERLAEIVLKACAFRSGDRYSTPAQMRRELEAVLSAEEETSAAAEAAAAPILPEEPTTVASVAGIVAEALDEPSVTETIIPVDKITDSEPMDDTDSFIEPVATVSAVETAPEPEGTVNLFGDSTPEIPQEDTSKPDNESWRSFLEPTPVTETMAPISIPENDATVNLFATVSPKEEPPVFDETLKMPKVSPAAEKPEQTPPVERISFEDVPPAKPPKRKTGRILLVLAAVLVCVWLGAAFANTRHVPDVNRLPESLAQKRLSSAGFQSTRHDPALDCYADSYVGTVVHQAHADEDYVPFFGFGAIEYGLSKGPEPIELEDYIGWDVDEATDDLEDRDYFEFDVETTSEYRDDYAAGYVYDMSPSPGSTVSAQETITLYVSEGPETMEIPDISGEDEDDAVSDLNDYGFSDVVIETTYSEKVKKGLVIKTEPAAGTETTLSDTITLVISKGSEYVKIPDLTGLTADEADEKLEKLGLTPDYEADFYGDLPAGQVMCQFEKSGDKVKRGTTIHYYLSNGKLKSSSGRTLKVSPKELTLKKGGEAKSFACTYDDNFKAPKQIWRWVWGPTTLDITDSSFNYGKPSYVSLKATEDSSSGIVQVYYGQKNEDDGGPSAVYIYDLIWVTVK